MNSLRLDLDYDRYHPGSDALVSVSWDFDDTPEALELRLTWNTSGKGTQDLTLIRTETIRPGSARGSSQFTIRLPWGPYSFSGKLISIIWAFELVAFPGPKSVRKEFIMGPHASEVLVGPAKVSKDSHLEG